MTDQKKNRCQPFGMAWIRGQQKPFYNPRRIRKGRYQGMIEVEYLAKAGLYRKIKIKAENIIQTDQDARKLARQMSLAEACQQKEQSS